jgi:uncharacterized protein YndB with AHSA1/START domain
VYSQRAAAPPPDEAPVRYAASRELLASREEVWAFLAEPYHLSDWWPTISGVRPDRRGLAAGARWEIVGAPQPTLFRRPRAEGVLLVREVDPHERVVWHLPDEKLDVEVRIEHAGPGRTRATVAVEGPWRPEVLAPRRRLPRVALGRLHALCQTADSL